MSEQVPFKDGMLTEPLSPPEDVRLKGVKCHSCGSMALGGREYCINCTSTDLEEHVFSKGYKYMELPTGVKPEEKPQQRRDYCEMRGFDPDTGIPTREILEKLGLKDVANKLYTVVNISNG